MLAFSFTLFHALGLLNKQDLNARETLAYRSECRTFLRFTTALPGPYPGRVSEAEGSKGMCIDPDSSTAAQSVLCNVVLPFCDCSPLL